MKKISSFQKIKLAAKKHTTRKSWMENSNASYAAARRRNLLQNQVITGHFTKPVHTSKWTLKKIIADAKKHKTRKTWFETPKSSYDPARSRGLLKNKDVIGHFAKTVWTSKWTFKKIIAATKKFKTKKEWAEAEKNKVCFSYRAAKERKLLFNKKVIGHFKPTDPAIKFFKEWVDKFPMAYQRAHRTNVLEKVTAHMERVGHKYKRCIYSIEVKNKNMIYIGLTFNFKQRIEQHLDSKRFVGIKKKYGKKSLIIKQITKYMPVEEAGKRENILITKCNKKGYQVLNKKKGGDLGSIASKWTKEKVIESAKKFKTQKKWRAKAPVAYSTAKQKGYLKEAQQFLYVQREKIRY